MKYNHIAKAISAEYDEYKSNHAAYIAHGDENRVKAYSTRTRAAQYDAGLLTLDELRRLAVERSDRKLEKEKAQELDRLERIENAAPVESVTVRVEWHRSRTWGNNPTAYVDVCAGGRWYSATDSASGCGYDKRSAAVGGAFGKIDAMLKILCDMKEKAISDGASETASNGNLIGYGSGYGAIPYYEGGVGVGCFLRILEKAGYKIVVRDESAAHSDYYYIEKAKNQAAV